MVGKGAGCMYTFVGGLEVDRGRGGTEHVPTYPASDRTVT